MNVENTATPDNSSGHGEVSTYTPNDASGHGNNNNTTGSSGTVNPSQPSTGGDYETRYQDLRNNFNQKITEMGQSNSQLQNKLQQIEQDNQHRQQRMAEALGFAQQEQEPDLVSQLIDNPQLLQELIQRESQKMMEPLQQQFARRETNEFLTSQNHEKQTLRQELSGQMSENMLNQVLDLTNSLSSDVQKIQNSLQNTYLTSEQRNQLESQLETQVAQEIRQAGGIRKLVYSKLGEMTATNFQGLMQDGAQIMRQNQMSMGRTGGAARYSGGAGVQQGQSTYRSQSVFR
jgi:uncharacterized protein YukE|tara:strand:+ start:9541 stop:10407 length:867 start_codon:yes stop_codon:yes gene_type:complete